MNYIKQQVCCAYMIVCVCVWKCVCACVHVCIGVYGTCVCMVQVCVWYRCVYGTGVCMVQVCVCVCVYVNVIEKGIWVPLTPTCTFPQWIGSRTRCKGGWEDADRCESRAGGISKTITRAGGINKTITGLVRFYTFTANPKFRHFTRWLSLGIAYRDDLYCKCNVILKPVHCTSHPPLLPSGVAAWRFKVGHKWMGNIQVRMFRLYCWAKVRYNHVAVLLSWSLRGGILLVAKSTQRRLWPALLIQSYMARATLLKRFHRQFRTWQCNMRLPNAHAHSN